MSLFRIELMEDESNMAKGKRGNNEGQSTHPAEGLRLRNGLYKLM